MGPSPETASRPAKPGNGVQGMHEGYSGLYFVSSTGGKGLPLELFLGVMRQVRYGSETALIRASHVCPGWRKAIVECADLWSDLDKVSIGSARDLERLRAFATRSKVRRNHSQATRIDSEVQTELIEAGTAGVLAPLRGAVRTGFV